MKLIRNPELRGILGLVLIILVLGTVLAATTGKLEQWFGITIFSGPRLLDKIVFVSDRTGHHEIYAMNPDGSEQKQLTTGASVLSAPSISPRGNRIAYVGQSGKDAQVFQIGANGGAPVQLTSATGPKGQPGYSPDGKKLSFIASGKVYIADLNGDNPSPVFPTETEMRQSMVQRAELPAYTAYGWGPDSTRMLGLTRDATERDVLVYLPSTQGGEPHNHEPGQPCAQDPQPFPANHISGFAWSSQKPTFAFAAGIGNKSIIVIRDCDQSQNMSTPPMTGKQFGKPCFSPDGSEVVIPMRSQDKKIPSGLLKLDLSTGQMAMIATGLFENPSYSPSGNRILAVKVGEDGDKRDIVLVDPSDGEVRQITTDGSSFDAIWSPASEPK